jgi:NDP-sugar pyrophosphorylase family protein
MISIDGKPILETLLEQFIAHGFTRFFLSVNYLKEQIINHFQDGKDWGISIDYLIENEPLGTAGSLKLLPSSIKEPFIVMNGDILTRLNPSQLLDFHTEHKAAATMCVREHTISIPFGVVETSGIELSSIKEKPTIAQLVNAGIYVLDPLLLPLLNSSKSVDMPNLLLRAQQNHHLVAVYPIHEYWIDVGLPETLQEAHATWRKSK